MELPPENLYDLSNQKNNSEIFTEAIDDISKKTDVNDIVFIHLGGHGDKGRFQFKEDEKVVSYQWMNEKLEKINSKFMIVNVASCYSGSAIEYLESNNRIIGTVCSADELGTFGWSANILKAFSNPMADKNGNHFVSIGEAHDWAQSENTIYDPLDPDNPGKNHHPQISDLSNLGQTTYLVEYQLDD